MEDIILKKGDIVTYRYKDNKAAEIIISGYAGKSIKEVEGYSFEVLKVERPVSCETIYEVKDILDKQEKAYLSAVIRPFRDRVESITKNGSYDSFISIHFSDWQVIHLPYFDANSMYKNMESDKQYKLEELAL